MSRHVRFGSKALIHGFLSEAFIRIDILILGIFLSDREVGVYSFAAFFVEGAYQVAIVVRTMANPILVRLLLAPGMTGLVAFARRTALLSFSATFLACAGIATVYPYLSSYMPQGVIEASYPILLILLLGLLIYSTCVPFDYLFLQSGRPGMQSIYMAVNASVNAILNFVFIPRWGLYGASIATAIAFAWSGTFLNILASSVLGLRGGVFFKHS
jgi:O-antigen/teichoic acid export membrane protein